MSLYLKNYTKYLVVVFFLLSFSSCSVFMPSSNKASERAQVETVKAPEVSKVSEQIGKNLSSLQLI